MRKIYILFVVFFAINGALLAQNDIKVDTDTLSVSREKEPNQKFLLRENTGSLVRTVFGETKQMNNADSIIKQFDALPAFGIYKDNYFIVGTEAFQKKNKWNSDAKFQISVRHRLTNSTLPFKTYLFLTYTQKAFWDVFRDSFPFRDLNFNPAIGIGKALVYDNRFLGTVSMQFEHESNGKDGEDSRSWNKVTFGAVLAIDDNWTLNSKIWIPIVDGNENKDIVHYAGFGLMGVDYRSTNKKYTASCVVTKRSGNIFNANVVLNFGIRPFKNDNQYLFLEFYHGFGESMLDYNQHRNRIRAGIVIKPKFLNIY